MSIKGATSKRFTLVYMLLKTQLRKQKRLDPNNSEGLSLSFCMAYLSFLGSGKIFAITPRGYPYTVFRKSWLVLNGNSSFPWSSSSRNSAKTSVVRYSFSCRHLSHFYLSYVYIRFSAGIRILSDPKESTRLRPRLRTLC